jgi:hypothetical protein
MHIYMRTYIHAHIPMHVYMLTCIHAHILGEYLENTNKPHEGEARRRRLEAGQLQQHVRL